MIIKGGTPTKKTVSQRLAQAGEQVASCPLGQFVLRGADRLLWTVETSVQWFVESKEPQENGMAPDASQWPTEDTNLVRPLPWALFLPLLVWLRLAKFTVELVATIGGREPPSPQQVVRFLRVRRRRLRGVKYQGLKNFRNWQRAKERNRQAEGECVVLKLLSLSPLATLAAFSGLGPVLLRLRGASPTLENQEGNGKAVAHDSESSDDNEDLLEKIERICRDLSSDEDPDYEPHEDEEEESDETVSSEDNEAEATDCQTTAVTTDVNPKTIPYTPGENRQPVATTPNTANRQAVAEIPDSNCRGAPGPTNCQDTIETSDETAAAYCLAMEQSDDLDDSSSTLSLESADACSESTSQTFYSPIGSSCVTPEPQPSRSAPSLVAEEQQTTGSVPSSITQGPKPIGPTSSSVTQEPKPPESAEAVSKPLDVEAEANPMKLSASLASLAVSTKSSDGSSLSGSTSSLKDADDTKERSTFSNFFQRKRRSRSKKT